MGRVNSLMTHLSVISVLEGHLKYSDVTHRLNSHKHVNPLDTRMLNAVTDGIIDYTQY